MYAFLPRTHISHSSPRTLHTLMRSHATLTPPPSPHTQHPTPNTQHPSPNTQHPTPNTQHPTPNTQHPTPNTQHPTPNTLAPQTLALESGRSRGSEATPYGGSPLLRILRTCGCQGEQTVQSVTQQVVVTQGGARDDTGGFSFRRGSADTATPHHASGDPDAQTHHPNRPPPPFRLYMHPPPGAQTNSSPGTRRGGKIGGRALTPIQSPGRDAEGLATHC